MTHPCRTCGQQMVRGKESHARFAARKYCSAECRKPGQTLQARNLANANNERRAMADEHLCAHCSGPIPQRPNENDRQWNNRVYCGVACSNAGRNQPRPGEKNKTAPKLANAACDGLGDVMFPPDEDIEINRAKHLCRSCPERIPCLEIALTNREQWGVWGGLTKPERERLLRKRNRHLKAA